ncbi:MAG: glycosyltransferase family 2 protein [Alphaproteobacteria bacterium]|nr:glycosyltransferase family 2 protein [Alphaproteobacteria bacterium]
MTVKLPISVFIIAKNEADRIAYTIRSVRDWVDEVIVIDSGSEDDTVKVAESLGARVVFNPWTGYGPQKVFGEKLCRNDWLFNLDADEEVSEELAEEIRREFTGTPQHSAYSVSFYPIYAFQKAVSRLLVHKRTPRLYRLDSAGFKNHPVHDSLVVRQGTVGKLKGQILHRSLRSVGHHVEKINSYSDMQAEQLFNDGKKANPIVLLLIFPLAFIKCYLLRRQFLNGIDGVSASLIYALHRYIRLAKLRELHIRSGFATDDKSNDS